MLEITQDIISDTSKTIDIEHKSVGFDLSLQ